MPAAGVLAVEELLEDPARAPGGAEVVLLDLGGRARRVLEEPPDAVELACGRPGAHRSSGPTAACWPSAAGSPAATPRPAGRRRPSGRARRRCRGAQGAERRGGAHARARRARAASCSSCTSHSTSLSDPGPSLRCRDGSTPCGRRSLSTRALIRLISRSPCESTRLGIAHLVGELDEVADELHASRHAARAQQRLRLPRQRPAAVVLGVGVERPRERAVAPLGAQVGVEVERHAVVLGVRAQRGDELQRQLVRALRLDAVRPVDVHDVGVGAEAELARRRSGPSR